MSRSALYTSNTTAQTVAAGGSIAPGSIVRRFGSNANLVNGSIVLNGSGYYDIDAQFTLTGTESAAATTTITLMKDGVAVPGAVTSASLASTDTDTIGLTAVVRQICCNSTSLLSFVVSGTSAVVGNAGIVVEKL